MTDGKSHWERAAECHGLGLEHMQAGRIEDAVRELREAVALESGYSAAWNDLGVVMEALGNARDAVYCYRRALKAGPDETAPRQNLVALALQMNIERSVCPQPARKKMAASAGA